MAWDLTICIDLTVAGFIYNLHLCLVAHTTDSTDLYLRNILLGPTVTKNRVIHKSRPARTKIAKGRERWRTDGGLLPAVEGQRRIE